MGGRGRIRARIDRQKGRKEGEIGEGGDAPVPPSFISTSKRPITTCDRVNKGRRTHIDNAIF